jgi:tetratricopeptide (TPR) repeat protein
MTSCERRTTLSWLSQCLSLVLAFALLATSTASAQRRRRRRPEAPPAQTTEAPAETPTPSAEPSLSDADRAQARALFQAGAAAVDAGRWADAIESFRAAYALTHAPSALFNTGYALRALGRYRESLAAFTELLALPNVADAMRSQTEELSTEVRGRIALIRLQGLDGALRYGVRLDGVALEDGGDRPLPVQADPGPRTLDVILEGYETFTWTGQLTDGQATDVLVQLNPLRIAGGGSVVDEAWFWALIGGIVLVGGGLAAYFIADDAAQLKPNQPLVIRY